MHADALAQLPMSTPEGKSASYQQLADQLLALLGSERDALANLSQFSALVFQQVPGLNWAGFYRVGNNLCELVLGPFQGKVACVRIPFEKGVCGACARTQTLQLVADVHAFPGHIACDAASNSEIVLPVLVNGVLWGVFDVDSPHVGRFDQLDAEGLSRLVAILVASTDFS